MVHMPRVCLFVEMAFINLVNDGHVAYITECFRLGAAPRLASNVRSRHRGYDPFNYTYTIYPLVYNSINSFLEFFV